MNLTFHVYLPWLWVCLANEELDGFKEGELHNSCDGRRLVVPLKTLTGSPNNIMDLTFHVYLPQLWVCPASEEPDGHEEGELHNGCDDRRLVVPSKH
jgi:hypothetical protein